MFKQIGNEKILSLRLKEDWTKEELYDILTNTIKNIDIKENNYETFYLKLIGNYDKSLLNYFDDDDEYKCYYCPNNPKYKKFYEYNQFKNNKINVLVLVSKFIDFKEYDIYAAYYTDKLEDMQNIELWGQKKTIFNSIFRFLGL